VADGRIAVDAGIGDRDRTIALAQQPFKLRRPDVLVVNITKGLAIGGSYQVNEFDPTASSHYGDVSAVIMQHLPPWAEFIRTPSLEVALMVTGKRN